MSGAGYCECRVCGGGGKRLVQSDRYSDVGGDPIMAG